MQRYLVVALATFLVVENVRAQNINIAAMIQQARNIASRVESPADVINIGEQVMREIPNNLLAFIPSTVATGKVVGDIKDAARKRFGIELTSEELADLQRGMIPVRIRVAIQSRIPDIIRMIQAVELHLKNVGTALYLLDNIIVPTVQPYLNNDLKAAVTDAVTFANANQAQIQAISSKLLEYTGMIKNALNSLQNLSDAQFKNKLVETIGYVQNQAIPLFNTALKPFVMQNQGPIFSKLVMFKGVRFSEADAQKVVNVIRSLAQGM